MPGDAPRADDVLLLPGEFWVGQGSGILRTLLGSCVAVALWQPRRRVAALCHFLLPARDRQPASPRDGRYADEVLAMTAQWLAEQDIAIASCEARIFGGADCVGPRLNREGPVLMADIGRRNVAAARAGLLSHGVPCVSEDVGGVLPRTLRLRVADGAVSCRAIRSPSPDVRGGAHRSAPAASRASHAIPAELASRVIVMGLSTGGVQALGRVLADLSEPVSGMVVVQHMPSAFTAGFAAGLGQVRPDLDIREARQGDRIEPGQVLIAPGGVHTRLERCAAGGWSIGLHDSGPVSHHKPAIDVLFQSAAAQAGARAIGVLMTGMGADGAAGLLALRRAGAATAAQDEASSVVFGMPAAALQLGAAAQVLGLRRVAPWLQARSRGLNPPASGVDAGQAGLSPPPHPGVRAVASAPG